MCGGVGRGDGFAVSRSCWTKVLRRLRVARAREVRVRMTSCRNPDAETEVAVPLGILDLVHSFDT